MDGSTSTRCQGSDQLRPVNAYALTFGVLLLSGGKLADLYGRRRIFIVGLVIFAAASLACGLAANAEVLIAARTVQGVGAALMNPATLSIITATFSAARARDGDRHLGGRLRRRDFRARRSTRPGSAGLMVDAM